MFSRFFEITLKRIIKQFACFSTSWSLEENKELQKIISQHLNRIYCGNERETTESVRTSLKPDSEMKERTGSDSTDADDTIEFPIRS